jgi:hypothetical protein
MSLGYLVKNDGSEPCREWRANDIGYGKCRYAKALQESLLVISNRVETIKDEHDKLYNNNKVLQRFIEDLTGSTKMTDSATRANPS